MFNFLSTPILTLHNFSLPFSELTFSLLFRGCLDSKRNNEVGPSEVAVGRQKQQQKQTYFRLDPNYKGLGKSH